MTPWEVARVTVALERPLAASTVRSGLGLEVGEGRMEGLEVGEGEVPISVEAKGLGMALISRSF